MNMHMKKRNVIRCYKNCFQYLVECKAVLQAKEAQPGTSRVYLIKWPLSMSYGIVLYGFKNNKPYKVF